MYFLALLLLLWSTAFPLSTANPHNKTLLQLLHEADAEADPPTFSTPLPPSLDPWYRPPFTYDWRRTEPGQVLKVRRAPLLNYTVPNALRAYQLLYRSTDSNYDPAWDVTTVIIPQRHARCPDPSSNSTTSTTSSSSTPPHPHPNRKPLTPWCAHALLSYQLPYDTCNVDASPSYGLYLGDPYGEIADALSLGWFVAVPDYEGPRASYAAGVQAGHATLDGVRAVLQVAGHFGLRLEVAKVALWGYSGGALATEWAAELSVQYAPKMRIAGFALGGLTPNVTSVTEYLNGTGGAGLIPQGLMGISSQHWDARRWIVSRLKPALREVFLSVKKMTAAQAILAFQYQDIYSYFVGGYDDLHTRVMQNMYDVDGYMGYHGVPRMPVFIYNAISDELSDIKDVDALVDRFCGVGANILYHRNTVGTHTQELVNGRPRAFAWLRSVLDGSYDELYSTLGCTIYNVTYNIAPWVR
ncbi:secretory lipase-domain-containing protein [Chaetomium fimeti]|uniref:Secretory lipase-domain-containing protein n=1 Tax=Chaetomium fimeti TaxID=1854472 RepID=A0AAE0LQU8_9PEZI|nr:secretory lipase-domain-containing protein [Chaetomium fimeti]